MAHDIIMDLRQLRLFGLVEAWGEFTDPDSSPEFTAHHGESQGAGHSGQQSASGE